MKLTIREEQIIRREELIPKTRIEQILDGIELTPLNRMEWDAAGYAGTADDGGK